METASRDLHLGHNTKSQVVANLAPGPVIEMNWVGSDSFLHSALLRKSICTGVTFYGHIYA